ncbi:hypothetical protein HOY82DRAFT_595317 [Tuber indicum]|nr:hypothetical protein HOY82DRAFT_595317 [Tuber indicum]
MLSPRSTPTLGSGSPGPHDKESQVSAQATAVVKLIQEAHETLQVYEQFEEAFDRHMAQCHDAGAIFCFAALVSNGGISDGVRNEKDEKSMKEGGCALFPAGTGRGPNACRMNQAAVRLGHDIEETTKAAFSSNDEYALIHKDRGEGDGGTGFSSHHRRSGSLSSTGYDAHPGNSIPWDAEGSVNGGVGGHGPAASGENRRTPSGLSMPITPDGDYGYRERQRNRMFSAHAISRVTDADTNIHAYLNYGGTRTDADFVLANAIGLVVAIATTHLLLLIIAVSAPVLVPQIGMRLWSTRSASSSSTTRFQRDPDPFHARASENG